MLISSAYLDLQKQTHEDPAYGAGTATRRWVSDIIALASEIEARSILDYGCGKGAMAQALATHAKGPYLPPLFLYDPCIEAFSCKPEPADLVICTDVLEHVEASCLESVLQDIRRCIGKVGFLTISTVPAKRTLPDGRNAHIMLKSSQEWLRYMMRFFHVSQFIDAQTTCVFIVRWH